MKKPVLGIIAIFLLQVTFIAYNAVELPIDMSAVTSVRETALAPVNLDRANDDIVVVRSGKPVSEALPRPTASIPTLTVTKRETRSVTRPEPIRPKVMLAVKRTPVRTEFPFAPIEYSDSNKAITASVVTNQAKKRSFFSKALPIIKKPYDWAKSFAGKLK